MAGEFTQIQSGQQPKTIGNLNSIFFLKPLFLLLIEAEGCIKPVPISREQKVTKI